MAKRNVTMPPANDPLAGEAINAQSNVVKIDPAFDGQQFIFKVKKVPKVYAKGALLLVPQVVGDYDKFPTAIAVGIDEVPEDRVGSMVLATVSPLPKKEGLPERWGAEIEEFLSEEFLASHGRFTRYGDYLDTPEGRAEYMQAAKSRLAKEVLDSAAKRQLEEDLADLEALEGLK